MAMVSVAIVTTSQCPQTTIIGLTVRPPVTKDRDCAMKNKKIYLILYHCWTKVLF